MVFSSTVFLLLFLPAVVILYYLCPRRWRNAVLLVFSLLFYAWGEPKYVLIMLFSTVFDYCNGLGIARLRAKGREGGAKAVMILSAVGNLAILGFFKYTDFAIANVDHLLGLGLPALGLALPIGISFYTFQTMSYTIDVYRGEVAAQRNILDFAAYVTLFPQLIAGPIVQYKTVAGQLHRRAESWQEAGAGMQRFVVGLAKKVLIANQVGALWETVSAMQQPSMVTAWLGALAFTFQIYFDFSGYSDMAIGLGRMLGFDFVENFNYPYISRSITEFWRRWHISLGTWFREYVYIPLGGNRRGMARQVFNLLVVWFLTGLWHGASWNFVLWGLYYGALLVLEKTVLLKALRALPAAVGHVYTWLCFVLGWVLFAITDFSALGSYLGAMFSGTPVDGTAWYLLRSNGVLLALAAVGCTSLPAVLWRRWQEKLPGRAATALQTAGVALLLTVSVAFLVGDSYNPFLYFRF